MERTKETIRNKFKILRNMINGLKTTDLTDFLSINGCRNNKYVEIPLSC